MTGSNAVVEQVGNTNASEQDTFGDQLTQEITTGEGSSLEIFLQDDDVFEF